MKQVLFFLTLMVSLGANDLTEGMEAIERKDFKSAVAFFEKAASTGSSIAKQNLAVMYNNGYGVKKDEKIATQWLNSATNHEIVRIVSRY